MSNNEMVDIYNNNNNNETVVHACMLEFTLVYE